ncbi:uncharacterized protein Z518_00851 [Rhinocladiella mackenziei CBS 650.93]|uniref:Rhinocladiella mackenziei CBS 650.93 unplaced genomic scaffold supercont1.1, whole genome shotgun sequence n=1 Tax=Rhinocladiella mackenziei CBS 650.93 TaxID=1442369 RepID=A0A0D2JJX2_9EURO|nr:uncharacterized protein Z518_00851 [Rhinocladiella mackenziei CBS 650.93]KIX09770.1 hypothetical protein Z518_00851 [Rhinocladiella mackenziei CBS 650.93]
MRSSVVYESLEKQERQTDVSNHVYNGASGTKKTCIAGLAFSILVGIGFVVLGILAQGRSVTFHLNSVTLELVPLAINVVVLVVTESQGYIHATSLRWALFYEGKLEFNTNLRLLTFSKHNFANGIIANAIFFISIAVCYGASAMILVRNTYEFYLNGGGDWDEISHLVSISKVTPIALGIAILIQCALSIWCLHASRIPTWSSDPLTTLQAASNSRGLIYQKGRCMMSVHDRSLLPTAMRPQARQRSPYAASPRIIHVLLVVTIVFFALVIWTGIIIHVGQHNMPDASWNFFPTAAVDTMTNNVEFQAATTQTVFLKFFASFNPGYAPIYVPEINMLAILIFCVAIQSFLTIGLHCAELQVILLRDENVWRTLMGPTGTEAPSLYNSVTKPLRTIPSVALLVFKPVVHWMFGSALGVDYAKGVLMRVPHVTYLMALWLVFLAFVGVISFTRPKGPLPATYGHLQTMLDVADELSDVMYWGDKGEATGLLDQSQEEGGRLGEGNKQTEVRHSGTSTQPLPAVQMDASYS